VVMSSGSEFHNLAAMTGKVRSPLSVECRVAGTTKAAVDADVSKETSVAWRWQSGKNNINKLKKANYKITRV